MTTARCIYLVRHGETEGESSIRYHGRNDVPLSDCGRRQVAGLIELIQHVRFAAVIHSPLTRAQESAQILIDGLQRPPTQVEVAPDLIEVNFGDMEGLTEPEIQARLPAWYADWKSERATGFPGGESFAGFSERVAAAFDGLLARHPTGHLLVVAHKGIIKRGAGRMLGLAKEATDGLDPELGSLAVLDCGDSVRLKHFNLTGERS